MKNSVVALVLCALVPSVSFGVSFPRVFAEKARACANLLREGNTDVAEIHQIISPQPKYKLVVPAKYYLDSKKSLSPVFRLISRVQNVMKDASPFLELDMMRSQWRIALYRALKPFDMFPLGFRKFESLIEATRKPNHYHSFMQFLEKQNVSDEWRCKIMKYLEEQGELRPGVWQVPLTSRNFKFPGVEARVHIPFKGVLDEFGDALLELDVEGKDLVIEVSSEDFSEANLERAVWELRNAL